MVIDIILFSLAIMWLLFASIQDIIKREVADWLSFSLLATALATRALYSIVTLQPIYFLYGIFTTAVFFLVALICYNAKFFGGGDAKLFTTLGAIFATTPTFAKQGPTYLFLSPFPLTFLSNVVLLGSAYGIFLSIVLAFRSRKSFSKEAAKVWKQFKLFFALFFVFVAALYISFLLFKEKIMLCFAIIFAIFPFLIILVSAVEKACLVKLLPTSKLAEGDWLAQKISVKGKQIGTKGLTREEIAILKKLKKKVKIKQGIPFVPVLFASALTSLYGNLLLLIIKYLMKI